MPIFASVTAPGGGTGTLLNPYTLREGIDNLNGDGTLECRGGNYAGIRGDGGANDPFVNLASGSGSGRTLVRAYENEPVNFFPQQDFGQLLMMPLNSTRIRFEGIIFNGNVSSSSVAQAMVAGHGSDSTAFWEFLSCIFQDTRGVVIQTSSTPDMKFQSCTWRRNRMAGSIGSYCVYVNGGSHRCEISSSLMEDNDSWMIHHYSTNAESNDCRYFKNTLRRWGTVEGAALILSNGSGNWVYNNLIMDGESNSSGAFEIDWNPVAARNTRSAIFAHNAIYNPGGPVIRLGQSASSPNLFLNNIGLNATAAVVTGGEQTPTYTTNLWQVAPSATAAQTWEEVGVNFLLKTGSAAINAGTYNANFPTDRNGSTRANPPDIGPYEFGAVNPPVNVIPSPLVTQVGVSVSFEDFNVSHGGDLVRIIVYPQSGSLA